MATKNITSIEAAQIIFGPTFYPLYKLWHRTISEPSQAQYFANNHAWQVAALSLQGIAPGHVPSNFHFRTFMNWLRLSGKLFPTASYITVSTLPMAKKCRHLIHPGSSRTEVLFCPACIMEQCCASLKRISDAWERIGGGPTAWGREGSALYFSVRKVWMAEKVRFANLVYRFEQLAEDERRYEDEALYFSKHSFEDLKIVKSCMEVLQVARKNCPYMVGGGDVDFVPGERFSRMKYWDKQALVSSRSSSTIRGDLSPCSPLTPLPMEEPIRPFLFTSETSSFSPPLSSTSSEFRPSPPPSIPHSSIRDTEEPKTVTFADDCVEYEKRRSIYWHRNSSHYKPGRHACPSDNGYFDTSNLPSTECDPDSSVLRTKIQSIMKSFFASSENSSNNNIDALENSSSDIESDVDSSNSSVTATVDSENGGSSRQSYHLAEKLQEECGDGCLPYDEKYGDYLILEDGHLNAIVSRDGFTSSVPDIAISGNKETTERAEANNMERKEWTENEMNNGKEMEMITSSLGYRSRETYETSLVDRNQAEIKRPRTERSS